MTPMHDLLAPYLLGSLDETEHEAFETHLLECDECQAEMADLEPGLSALAYSNAVAPPPKLKEEVLSALPDVQQDAAPLARAADRSWTALLLPVAAIVVLVVGFLAIFSSDPIEQITGAPDAIAVALVPSDAFPGNPPATAQVVFSPEEQGAVIEITGLASPSGSNVYEMWLIGSDGPEPAGTFTPDAAGTVLVQVEGDAEPGLVVGITEEPAGGSEAPTGDVLLSAEL
jgi:anti-sigma-K factor RskA